MNDKNNCSPQKTFNHQRRTVSVGDASGQLDLDDECPSFHENQTSKYIRSISQINEDDYICTTLPRTGNTPIAKTCRRAHSAFAPSPKSNFGPKATLKKVQDNDQLIVIQDPSSQRLHWIAPPTNILIIRKPGPQTMPEFRELLLKLLKRRLNVYIELSEQMHLPFATDPELKAHGERCHAFDHENDFFKIDLIICLGGDGTLLHVSNMFQKSCPPVLSFSMGSLGFLTPFDYKNHEKILNEVVSGNVAVLLRSRLRCSIVKGLKRQSSSAASFLSASSDETGSDETGKESSSGEKISHLALNEVVIDRGPNSYLSNLDLYINDRFITKVQGDGLIVSTTTGSTAYAMAAGSSMVHPNVPAIVICPICPHSLSFRPIVVPAGIELKITVSEETRLTAWLSVDGRNRHELQQQDYVHITTSVYPVPSICRFDQLGDWFESLADILHWNLRKAQGRIDSNPSAQRDAQLLRDEKKDSSPSENS
ncbi:unnamed protein product [Rotaria socialis]|uniref:NAD(+) kinase n=1 Tax=Rotaria socialis TaxID=392032 RepID=A0A817XJZ7_9BILA|nr:unnamed protein product [Rotaria socialis]CAF3309835.1 unnamed protein product [Rotaria socialis]CAF3339433.1 unnamed protein product [Rotaria socialis]CAF3369232.1 unnamed protein product [Rotaria socialis]CAF3386637.1 unnamed protein product [Rotaria socialis]